MLIWTHRTIAEFVFEAVSASRGGVLNRKAFIRGNMLPDLNSRYRRFPHDTDSCWPLLELLTEEMDRQLCITERGSEKMGIICHFIADFFCQMHNRPYSDTVFLLDHMLYEYHLHGLYRNLSRKKNHFKVPWGHSPELHIDSGRQWLETGLSALHRDYLDNGPSMEKDITCALNACVTYCLSMIDLEKRQLAVFASDAIA